MPRRDHGREGRERLDDTVVLDWHAHNAVTWAVARATLMSATVRGPFENWGRPDGPNVGPEHVEEE